MTALAATATIVQALDLALFALVVSRFGIGVEDSVQMRALYTSGGLVAVVAAKVLVVTAVLAVAFAVRERWPWLHTMTLTAVLVVGLLGALSGLWLVLS